MGESILLSTAYFPPAEYFSRIAAAGEAGIEKWESYHKQTYRTRCVILGANGPLSLTVPVLRGSFHKTPVRELEIDYGRRWRENHLRSIVSAYATAPFFEYYIDIINDILNKRHKYLIDLNMDSLAMVNRAISIETPVIFTDKFLPDIGGENDYRYIITPKKKFSEGNYREQEYIQVFSDRFGFTPRLSIIDMLLNNGPGTKALLLRSLE